MEAQNSKKPHLLTKPMIEMYEQGFSTTQIGKKFGIGKSSVSKRLKKLGIELKQSKDYSREKRYWLWKGNDYLDPLTRKRNQAKHRKWSSKVRVRDKNKCQDCGAENV